MLPKIDISNFEFFALACTLTALSVIKNNLFDYCDSIVFSKYEDLLLFGALILYNTMKYYNVVNVIVSNKGLRYGIPIKNYFMTSDTCSE